MEAIKQHTEWLKSLPEEEARKVKLQEMIEAGIWDENGQLTELYRRTEI